MVITPLAKVFLLAVVLGFSSTGPSLAQSVQVLGDFRAWSAFSANDGGGVICFAASKPQSVEPTPQDYAEAGVYLTHRPAEGIRNEFNLIAGFEFSPDATATATIGGQVYELFTQLDAAWLADVSLTERFAGNIRSGATLLIQGVTVNGLKITQTFSLSGATAASRAINAAC